MCVVKIVNKEYATQKDLYNLVNYAIMPEHCICGLYGTQGLLKADVATMTIAMSMVKNVYGKTKCRQALHCIVSFSNEEMQFINANSALYIGYEVAFFFNDCQVVFGVHDNEDNLHIHFVINTTSYKDGKQYAIGPAGLYKLKSAVENIVRKYIPRPENPIEAIDRLMG